MGKLATAAVVFAATFVAAPATADDIAKPNVVLIVTDDQRFDTFSDQILPTVMPNVYSKLVHPGVRLNGMVPNSWCCPSRASILTGNYSHTTGIYTNTPGRKCSGYGGYACFKGHADQQTLAVWLHAAGYRTGLIGKYLNGYSGAPIPGWDSYAAMTGGTTANDGGAYYDYDLAETGGLATRYGSTAADYSTNVLAGKAVSFIRTTHADQPLFLYFAPYGPHGPFTPAPGDANVFNTLAVPRYPPNLGEEDVSDKPSYIQAQPRTPASQSDWDGSIRKSSRPLASVDRAFGSIYDELEARGQVSNTVFIIISDNGFARGENRWTSKEVPYEASIRVPFAIRYDPLNAHGDRAAMALNIDIAPTLAEVIGFNHPAMDGQSLVPVLAGRDGRDAFLLEHKQTTKTNGIPTFCGVRTATAKYVHYVDGFEELYDLAADPFEMSNRLHAPTPEALAARDALKAKAVELCKPVPPGFSW